jgi:hypothetical protein
MLRRGEGAAQGGRQLAFHGGKNRQPPRHREERSDESDP